MNKPVDTTRMSAHMILDNGHRIRHIENSVGWGTIIVETPDPAHEGTMKALTSTGVIIVTGDDGIMVTAWIANVKQAVWVWKHAKGDKPLPNWLWNKVNYNNNTDYWKRVAA